MHHQYINDATWALIAPRLPPERGRPGRPSIDNRLILEGIFWVVRTGAPWRELPERFGHWNTVWRRFARWRDAGVFEAILETLTTRDVDEATMEMIGSTIVRAHQHEAGQKGELLPQ